MTAIEELQTAVATLAERVGPSIVGIGRGTRGSGVVIADGKVLTNAHNLRGDEVTVTFADGRRTRGTVAGWDGDGDLAVIDVDTAGATAARVGRRRRRSASGPPSSAPGASHGGGTRVTFGLVSAVARAFRGPGGRRIDGSVEHTAPLAPGSSGGALLDAEGRLVGTQHQPDRRGLLPGPPRGRGPADPHRRARRAASRPSGRGSAWPSPRTTSPVGCAARSASRSVTASSSAGSRTAAWPRRPGSRPATSSSRPAARRSPMPTTCTPRSATLELPFEVKLVRGTDERTVQVGGGTKATGEA